VFRNSILPSKTIDPAENLEQYMEIEKPDTHKLEQMVNEIPEKVRTFNCMCSGTISIRSNTSLGLNQG
jgi:hypothetical protein